MATFRQVVDRFVAHNDKLVRGRMLAATTADKYRRTANIICRYLGDTQVEDINRVVGQEYAADRAGDGIGASTINYELQVLRAVLSFASELGYVKDAPTIRRVRDPRQEPDLPDLDEVRHEVERLPDEHREPLLFSLLTGASWYEIERLEWQDIDFKRGRISIGKRDGFGVKTPHRARVLAMSKPVRQLLKDVGPDAPDKPVFPRAKSTAKYLRRHELPFSPATMRKLFASRAAGLIPEHQLQRLLGHSPGSAITRKHYVRSSAQQLTEGMNTVAEAMA